MGCAPNSKHQNLNGKVQSSPLPSKNSRIVPMEFNDFIEGHHRPMASDTSIMANRGSEDLRPRLPILMKGSPEAGANKKKASPGPL